MLKPSIHPQESRRLASLHSYQVLDTLPEQSFDDITKLASQICEVPISVISLVDQHRQWFKSCVGLNADETSRDVSFCGHAILVPGLLEIPDTLNDSRFADNPLVIDGPHIRFYAGMPLIDPSGMPLGTLCVIDTKPRTLNQSQKNALAALSRLAVQQLESRKTNLGLQEMMVRFSGESEEKKERLTALGQFSKGVAHEINNPLAIIMGLIEIVNIKHSRQEDVGRELVALKKAASRVAHVVTGLKNFAQQRSLPVTRPVSMQELMTKLSQKLAPMSADLQVTIMWPGNIDGVHVKGDEAQLYMAFEHILKNALEAAANSSERKVKVEANVEQGWFVFRCSDSGAGIPPQLIERLFEPFFTTKPPGRGQGLGLSVARGILMAHGGSVDLIRALPTTFEIRLP